MKHEVVDPYQVERTHPVFYSVQETFESWTRALMDLKPRQAYVKLGSKTAKLRTLNAAPTTAAVQRAQSLMEHYSADILRLREDILAPANGSNGERATPQATRFLRTYDH